MSFNYQFNFNESLSASSSPVDLWTTEDVIQWLRTIPTGNLLIFRVGYYSVTGRDLGYLTLEDLKRFGAPRECRKALLEEIKKLTQEDKHEESDDEDLIKADFDDILVWMKTEA